MVSGMEQELAQLYRNLMKMLSVNSISSRIFLSGFSYKTLTGVGIIRFSLQNLDGSTDYFVLLTKP